MNKQLFRLVFNKTRGQLMAVAESATSHSGGGHSRRRRHLPVASEDASFTPHPLALAVLLFLTGTVGLVDIAHAQIIGDPTAAAHLRPSIGAAGNGIPVVNIQTPSAAGVSRNVYSQFDIQTAGAILNNAGNNAPTQLGGWIAGNPQLIGGTARIILNEVNSSAPSTLRGYLEVAGDQAQVIIANPAGITCDGCGFINANRATLTTGTPVMSGGNLDAYRVEGGHIRIDGAGLDSSRTDYTDLIARSVDINAGLWANTLKITSGANQVDAAHTTATPITGSGAAPAYAIDVAQLGGMYAGKITLVGTDAGLGMRHAGTLGASVGEVAISIDGQLTNSGRIAAQGALAVNAADLDNSASGQITAGTAARLDITHTLTNRGLIDASQTRLNAATVSNLGTGRLYGDDLGISATTLTNDKEGGTAPVIAARHRLDLGIATLNNREGGQLFSAGDLAIGGNLDATGQATGSADTVNNHSASIEALGHLAIAAQTINNTNLHFTTTVDDTATAHTEYQGSGSATRYPAGTPGVYTFDDESLHLHTPENPYIETWYAYNYTRTTRVPRVLTSAPADILAGGDMTLTGTDLLNDQSRIIAGGTLTASLTSLTNTDAPAEHRITDSGTLTTYWRDYHKGRDSTGSSTIAYAPAPTIQSINLSPTTYQDNTTPVGTTPAPTLPNNALFSQNPSPNARYLIESDPRLTSYRTWISSDLMLAQLAIDPATTQKRLGDGYYEQKRLREQVAQLTGRRFLDGYANDEDQYRALMTSAVTLAQAWQLIPGVALTAAQIAQLTSDIVWLVEREVKLADGSTQKVLAPQLYLAPRSGDLSPSGALFAAHNLQLNLSGDFSNAGTVAGRHIVQLAANSIRNLGTIRGDSVSLNASTDLNNQGGRLEATDNLSLQAGRDITVASTTSTQSTAQGSRTHLDRLAGLYLTGSGTLSAIAGRDLQINGAEVINTGSGTTTLAAGNNLSLGVVTERNAQTIVFDGRNHLNTTSSADIGTQIQTTGDLTLLAGNDLSAKAVAIQATGNVSLSAGNDISIQAGQRTETIDEATFHESKNKRPGFGFSIAKELIASGRSTSSHFKQEQTDLIASQITGKNLTLQSQRDTTLEAARLTALEQLKLTAGHDLAIVSAEQTKRSQSENKTIKTSGPVGKKIIKTTLDTDRVRQIGSTLSGQRIDLLANNNLTLAASSLDSPGDVNLTAGQQIAYLAATHVDERHETLEKKNNLLNPENLSLLFDNGVQKDTIQSETSRTTRTAALTRIQSEADVLSQSGGDTTLQGTQIKAGRFTASAGRINGDTVNPEAKLILAGVKESSTTNHSESTHSFLWQRMAGQGSSEETLKMPEILLKAPAPENPTVNPENGPKTESAGNTTETRPELTATGGLIVDAVALPGTAQEARKATASGDPAQPPATTALDLKAQAHELAQQPGMAWLDDLTKRTDVDWKTVQLVHDNWDYKHSGLTQEGGIVVAIVVTILTWGAASAAGTSVATSTTAVAGSTAGAAAGAATTAAITTLASQAAISLINNQGDVGKTLEDLSSDESIQQLLASVLTAGVTAGVTSGLNLPNPATSTTFASRFTTYATQAMVGAGVKSLVYGQPLEETAKTALITALAQSLTSEIGDWGKEYGMAPGSAAKIVAHAVVQCAAASIQNNDCGSAALGGAIAEALAPVSQAADASELSQNLKLKGQIGNAIASMSTLLAATLTGSDTMTALGGAQMVDYYNRQLHPEEARWIKDNAKRFAQEQGISEDEATRRLTQQALKEVDFLWRAQLADGNDTAAKSYLGANGQSFVNELGEQQILFTAQGQQLFRTELYADTADPTFYKDFAQSGISRSLGAGLTKELKDAGIDFKDGAITFAQAVAQDPGAAVKGLFNALANLPGAIKDSVVETGQALGEGAAAAFNPDIQAKLNAIYGVDVSTYQKTLFALRVIGATTGALGAAKAGTAMGSKTTEAVVKQLDKALDEAAQKTLVKSGGAFDNVGNPLLDLKQLSTDQKRVMGELFGENTVKQIVPDGQKLARMPGTGETGIDDLYKVSRADVDYVVVEYKFVGSGTGKGSTNLGNTLDGKQGSEGWTLGSGRLEKAVGDDLAVSVDGAMRSGRVETWVVTTRPDGSTIVEVLDAMGKPKSVNTSKILNSGVNLSGAKL